MKKILAIILILLSGAAQSQNNTSFNRKYASLEVSFITLNAVDYVTTIKGLELGATEANPLLKNLTPLGLLGVKTVTTTGFIIANRSLKRQNPKAAMGIMIGANLLYGLVVANNISVIIKLR